MKLNLSVCVLLAAAGSVRSNLTCYSCFSQEGHVDRNCRSGEGIASTCTGATCFYESAHIPSVDVDPTVLRGCYHQALHAGCEEIDGIGPEHVEFLTCFCDTDNCNNQVGNFTYLSSAGTVKRGLNVAMTFSVMSVILFTHN